MPRRCPVALGLLVCLAAPAAAAEPAGDKPDAAAVARRTWAITDTVLAHHVAPPARAKMLLAGMTAFLKGVETAPPEDLAGRVAALTAEEQLAALLKELWPAGDKKTAAGPADLFLQGLFKSVPGGAQWIPAADLRAIEQVNNNRYVGTGIQLSVNTQEKLTQIVYAFPNGPARRAGARHDDLIVAVNDTDVAGMPLARVVELLRGDEGTPVAMTVRQPGSDEKRTLKMIRSVVPFETVVGYRRPTEETWEFRVDAEAPVAYVRPSSLTVSCLHELRQIERRLQADGFRALVLDLRFSFNAEPQHAALLADGLLDGGTLWRERDGRGRVKEYRADRDCLFRDWPLAVLVGETTRGTPVLLLAAALQGNRRATVVGEPARADGYLTGLVKLADGSGAVRLRTGSVERTTPGLVVQPDHLVPLEKKQRDEVMGWLFDQQNAARRDGKKFAPAPADPQLAKAVEVLRAALKNGGQGG